MNFIFSIEQRLHRPTPISAGVNTPDRKILNTRQRCYHAASGNSTVKTEPLPKTLSTFIFPLCAVTISFT